MLNKPIIGIITRKNKSEEGNDISIIYKNIEKSIESNNGIPIGITLNENYKELINLCNGIVFQGGDDFEEYDLLSLSYVHEINKPVLGICLGMQLMGCLFDGNVVNIKNHKNKLSYSHDVILNKGSKLYNIYKKDVIKVNSRHNFILKNTNLKITGLSGDGYIEAIEDPSKKFFLGVQWHPETMLEYDPIQNNLFKCFIKYCK